MTDAERNQIIVIAQRMSNVSGDMAAATYRSERYLRARDAYYAHVTDLSDLLDAVQTRSQQPLKVQLKEGD